MPFTFGPRVRLRSRRQFQVVQQQGRRVATRHLTVLGLPNSVGCDRLGIVASRKIGGAVVRNRAKRRIREILRHYEAREQPAAPYLSLDVVAIARRELPAAPFAAIDAELCRAIRTLRSVRIA
jgi:ribonuclease P protein component